jgi:hypothetical protein
MVVALMEVGRTLTDRLFLSTMGEPGGQQFLLQVRGLVGGCRLSRLCSVFGSKVLVACQLVSCTTKLAC